MAGERIAASARSVVHQVSERGGKLLQGGKERIVPAVKKGTEFVKRIVSKRTEQLKKLRLFRKGKMSPENTFKELAKTETPPSVVTPTGESVRPPSLFGPNAPEPKQWTQVAGEIQNPQSTNDVLGNLPGVSLESATQPAGEAGSASTNVPVERDSPQPSLGESDATTDFVTRMQIQNKFTFGGPDRTTIVRGMLDGNANAESTLRTLTTNFPAESASALQELGLTANSSQKEIQDALNLWNTNHPLDVPDSTASFKRGFFRGNQQDQMGDNRTGLGQDSATGQVDTVLNDAKESEDTVDITEKSIDSDLGEIFADKDIEHLEAELGKKYKAKTGEEFKLSHPAKKDAFEAAGLLSKKGEVKQLTTEAIEVAKARRRYVRSRGRQIAQEKGITEAEINTRIETVKAGSLQTQDEVLSARIEIEALEKARERLAKGNVSELSAADSQRLGIVVEASKKQMDLLQDQFNSTMKKIEGENPDPRNTYLHYLRNLPDLIQQYPDAGRILAEVNKDASNKKKLILMLIILTLGSLPIWDELKKMMQIQN